MFDLQVLLDTTFGSLTIQDGGRHWKFNAEQRMAAVNKLLSEMNNEEVTITKEKQ